LEVYFQRGKKPIRVVLAANKLFYFKQESKISTPPAINPICFEIEEGDTITVSISSSDENSRIYYTIDGSEPSEKSKIYEGAFKINTSTLVKAVSITEKQEKSSVTHVKYQKVAKRMQVQLKYQPNSKYMSRGEKILIDKHLGSKNYSDGKWLGFDGNDFDVTINLREIKVITSIGVNFVSNPNSWIFVPQEVSFYISEDGKEYIQIMNSKVQNPDYENAYMKLNGIKHYKKELKNVKTQFIRIYAKNIGLLPGLKTGRIICWVSPSKNNNSLYMN